MSVGIKFKTRTIFGDGRPPRPSPPSSLFSPLLFPTFLSCRVMSSWLFTLWIWGTQGEWCGVRVVWCGQDADGSGGVEQRVV